MLDGLRPIASKDPPYSVLFGDCEFFVLGERPGDDDMLATVSAIGESRLKDRRAAEGGARFWMPPLAEWRAGVGTDL